MKRVFLDTNFIVDYLVREDYCQDAECFLACARDRNIKLYISYLTVANFAYIVRNMPSDVVVSMIQRICDSFRIVKNTKEQIERNIALNPSDFEDGLQYQAAVDAKCESIITRNKNDFSFSEIPVMSPAEYLETYFDNEN